jgi:lipoprotein-releasing system permease protein
MYKLFMALRYLRAHKIIYFSIAGVAVGIMTLVVVTSIMGGFSRDMRSRIRGMQADIVVTSRDRSLWILNYEELCERIRRIPRVRGCAPRLEYAAWLGRGGNPRDVVIVGIDPRKEREVGDLESYFREGNKKVFDFRSETGREAGLPGVVVGSELRGKGHAGFITARHSTTPILCVKDFDEVGYFRSRMTEYDSNYVFVHLPDAQEFLKLASPPAVNQLAVSVEDYERDGRAVRAAVIEALHAARECESPGLHRYFHCGPFETRTWEQVRANLLAAVDVERGIMIIILFLIVVVAAFNIASIYTLVVRAKTRDIGILRALGATEGGVTSIFLVSGGLCGVIGSLFGLGLGLLFAWNVNEIEGFVRVVSREMNERAYANTGEKPTWAEAWAAAGALAAAAVALVSNWWIFYRERRPHPWGRMAAALVLLPAAAVFSTLWSEGYRPDELFDPDLGPGFPAGVVAAFAAVWILFAAAWRLLDRWRSRPAWIFFGFAGTIVLSALLVVLVATLAIAASIAILQPGPGWRGLELFNRQIYYLERIPVYVDYRGLAFIVATTLVVSVIFAIYPALRAASANPIDVIRDEA